ncbi:alpha/beta fold hydrolase [Chelatococcus asaccharovorans]|uniref:Alpha/beta hydrolase family protein n=1 Tax=Chelatococcus asaccharovorans TaxID=28210 RepID=A0A2V3U7L5_9HYPH|nr:alpha/beta fold hydrolase [Chelatococcus asaccharovorans]MBS7706042.1 alpha/beta fold hydrolase [Chelatococcus asaccharovorans]PXW59065.1 alpha/beta hydrolase family protein [Chelatococcus asaccharovorans]
MTIGGITLGSAVPAQASSAPREPSRRVFVLVHGAWHNALHWNAVALALARQGASVIAIDLPGHGLKAKFPRSYLAQDTEALLSEPSPSKGETLDDYAHAVTDVIDAIDESADVTLVGHSMSGLVVTRAGDLRADRLQRIVYVTAYVPVIFPNSLAYIGLPENEGARSAVFIGNPDLTGAVRINPRSTDAAYIEEMRATFFNDLGFDEFAPHLNALTPDLPLGAVNGDARGTAAHWGRVPRSYVRCTLDQAIPLALQDRMIREADAAYPDNRFAVHSLESGHSPFASKADALAAILIAGA